MAQLFGLIVSDDGRVPQIRWRLLRSGRCRVRVAAIARARRHAQTDLVIVDIARRRRPAMTTIEAAPGRRRQRRHLCRRAEPPAGPDPSGDAGRRQRVLYLAAADDTFHEAIRRTAARRESSAGAQACGHDAGVLRRQGRRRDDDAGCELRRRTRAPAASARRSSSTSSRASARSLCSSACAAATALLDALDNLHRLDAEFLRELVAKHKSGLEILAGSDHFERPGAGDTGAIEEVLPAAGEAVRVHRRRRRQPDQCLRVAALYAADTICLVANPDVPSIRNAQRLLERIRAARRVRRPRPPAAEPRRGAVSDSAGADRERRSGTRSITRSRATTRRCRRRSTPASRWR